MSPQPGAKSDVALVLSGSEIPLEPIELRHQNPNNPRKGPNRPKPP